MPGLFGFSPEALLAFKAIAALVGVIIVTLQAMRHT